MNIATKASSLYGAARDLRSPRDLEYEIFSRVTGQLQAALDEPPLQSANEPRARLRLTPRLAVALNENRRLWDVLATDLAHPDNGLPADLRAGLLSLARFTIAETGRILAGLGDAAALIDINTAVMRGLRQRGSGT